jgi:hypothetical protein
MKAELRWRRDVIAAGACAIQADNDDLLREACALAYLSDSSTAKVLQLVGRQGLYRPLDRRLRAWTSMAADFRHPAHLGVRRLLSAAVVWTVITLWIIAVARWLA